MPYPKYNSMSYPNISTYPQIKGGIYLNVNNQIPLLVNNPPSLLKPICSNSRPFYTYLHTKSFSKAMLSGEFEMKQQGVVTKTKC